MSAKKNRTTLNTLVKIAILSALAFIVMYFEIPLWFAPPFYKIDLSEVVVMIGAFALGPVQGIAIEALKIVLKLLIKGTSTAFVGDFANFLIGIAYIVPAAIIYKKHKSRSRAITGMIIGTLVMTILGSAFNGFVLIPLYSKLYNMPLEAIISMGTAVNANITSVWTMVAFAVVPFNLLKGILTSIIVALLYKHVSPILHR